MNEHDWLTATDPRLLAGYAAGQVDVSLFRPLAAAWCLRIRRVLSNRSREWVRAFDAWWRGGPPPDEVITPDHWSLWCATDGGRDDPHRTPAEWAGDEIRSGRYLPSALTACEVAVAVATAPPVRDPMLDSPVKSKRKRAERQRLRQDAQRAADQFVRTATAETFCHHLRDVVGNPFRGEWRAWASPTWRLRPDVDWARPLEDQLTPDWRTEAVRSLAGVIRAGNRFDLLPVLADALEESGCEDPELLDHCRQPARHFPGCWAVESVVGEYCRVGRIG